MVDEPFRGWKNKDTVYYKTFGVPPVTDKIAAFDLDSTLVYTPSFYTTRAITSRPSGGLIISPNDYVLYSPKVTKYLERYHMLGYVIVIFSNQKGPSDAGLLYNVKARMDNIFSEFKLKSSSAQLPLHVVFSTSNDKYRKPKPGMYRFFKEHLNNGLDSDLDYSFYVGDAAGRIYDNKLKNAMAKNLKKALDKLNINFDRTFDHNHTDKFEDLELLKALLKNDHSNCDLMFAKNIKFKFYTPEEIFEI
ncbi:Polynucleotide kinase 3 phosphatase [Babesia microti strain RI]|uniref:Polynucleotide kinase 3 phosphatase n=1 Tax=Babesia microti (strain RI) TaxID=1133968 RepID=A0A1N6LYJ4_BABMR|nr:Polynucleotide kinase 3 phosphatase [Babesia microti strain RI]SIO73924.1 Polynucleotide kinase 3 phosphatase [Babesia microti strain RI]|eukprot:XP_021337971.1 Polynucleotide kinase 3 phosphatase [Babesia microti strain RI]